MPGTVTGNHYFGADSDAFIAILNPDGTLLRSAYLGGSGIDIGLGVAVDSQKNVIAVAEPVRPISLHTAAFRTRSNLASGSSLSWIMHYKYVPPAHGTPIRVLRQPAELATFRNTGADNPRTYPVIPSAIRAIG